MGRMVGNSIFKTHFRIGGACDTTVRYLRGTPPLARDLRQNRSATERADCVYPAIFRFEYDNNRKTRQDISDGADGRICAPNAK